MSISTRIQILEFQATEAEILQLGHNQTPDPKWFTQQNRQADSQSWGSEIVQLGLFR